MTKSLTNPLRRPLALAAVGVILATATVAVSRPAEARVFIGFGFPFYYGPPAYYYPPPVYYPPPAYYPPPPAYYAPPTYAPPAPPQYSPSSQSCLVGGTPVCPMEHPVATGSACYCTTAQGRVWGRAT